MKICFVSPVFVLLYVGIVLLGVNCTQLPCHSCTTLLQNNQTSPKCNRTVVHCDSQNYFCGILLWYDKNTGMQYKEFCVPHHVCINVTAGCPKQSCFLSCCTRGLCNIYNDEVNQTLASFNHNMVPNTEVPTQAPKTTQEPSKTVIKHIQETPPPTSLALLLKCSRLPMVLLLTVILKDFVEI